VKHNVTYLEDPNAVAFVGVAVGVGGLPYLRMARAPLLVHVEEFRIILLGYVVEEKLASFFVKIKIALIIFREAVVEDDIVAPMPAESCKMRRTFELLV